MNSLSKRFSELDPKKRELLRLLLKEQSVDVSRTLIVPQNRDTNFLPLSFAQERLWFLDQLDPGNASYNEPFAVRLSGPLNHAVLERSINEIIRRHEALRTSFSIVDERPVQVISPCMTLTLPAVDLRHLPPTDREANVQVLLTHESQRPFDLTRGPLFRFLLLRLDEENHVLQLTIHHIVSDAWSIQLLVREMAALYGAFAAQKASPLPDLSIQYADFALWQRRWLQGDVLEEQLSYWRNQLAGKLPVLELPTDRPRPAEQSFRGARLWFELPKYLSEGLKTLSRQLGTTLFMTLLAAFKVLLHRYTAQEDIIVGSPMANRNRAEINELLGFFSNILPLRTRMGGNPSFVELMSRVREVVLEAYAHQDIPFAKLVEALQPERDPSHTALFQVAYELQDAPMRPLELPGLTLSTLDVHSGSVKFDLALHTEEAGLGLNGSFEYNTDLFDDSTITRMLGHFRTLLQGIVTNPNELLSDLPLMTDVERHQLLTVWNDTSRPFPSHRCIHQIFRQQVQRTPDAIAVACGDERISYQQLDCRANQLAHYLRTIGVGTEVIVAIFLEPGIEVVVAALGILKAGGAFLPLDAASPLNRLALMLEDAQVAVLLTEEGLLDRLPAHWAQVITIDGDWERISGYSQENVESGMIAENLAYVIYTSGSTGTPKAVLVDHRGLVNLSTWHQRTYGVTESDRATQLAGLAFDASIWELWPYLIAGASIHIPEEETIACTPKFLEWLAAEAVTMSFFPTPLAEVVLDEPWPSGMALRALLTGGDKLHRSPQRALPFKLINHYGPTENTVVTTCASVVTGPEANGPPPIGRPIANVQVYVLDRNAKPAPTGVPGELYVSGDSLARGYLNRPELTAEKFSPNPFSDGGARLYGTGDLVRYLPDANIEFLGRIDHQVKIRGFRIEIGDIEAALSRHPGVRETVVTAWEDSPGDKRLAAYIVARQGGAPTVSELRSFLKQMVPEYMLPASFVTVDSFPLTPNGKVDRRALRSPDHARTELEKAYAAPRNAVEQTLANIWSEIIRVDRVGIHDNFFELGGDSILGVQFVARANQAGLRLTTRQLFQHQTIAELAAVAGAGRVAQAEQGLITGGLPLTPIQTWFFEQGFSDPQHFNQAILLEVRQALNPFLLEKVIKQLLVHHDSLRLRFREEAQGWRQAITFPDEQAPFSRLDLSGLSDIQRAEAFERAADALQSSLNLSDGPLVRVALLDLGPQETGRLLIVIHNLAVDGVSWRVLLTDLETGYDQLKNDQPVQLPPKTSSYKHWAERLTEYAQSGALRQELPYWLAETREPVAGLPVDFPGGANTEASARIVLVALDAGETQKLLHDVPEVYHTEINDVLVTALAQALARWTNRRSLLLDMEGHGREEIVEDVDLSRTVGWFTTIFPVRLDLEGATSSGEALKSVREQLRRIPNRGIGYGLLRYLSGDPEIVEKLQGMDQAEVNFNYLGQFDQTLPEISRLRIARESAGPPRSLRQIRHCLIEVNAIVVEGWLQVAWTYSENIHWRATVEELAKSFIDELRSFIARCQNPEEQAYTPADFPLAKIDEQELDKLFNRLKTIDQSGSTYDNDFAPESRRD